MAKSMSKAGQELLDEVLGIKKGTAVKKWTPEQLMVIQARKSLDKTQGAFAKMLRVPVATIRDWEQGRRKPDSAAITLVKVAQKHPEAVMDVA